MSLKESIIEYFIRRELKKEENKKMLSKLSGLWTAIEGKKSTWLTIVSLITMVGNICGYVNSDQAQQLLAICGVSYAGTMAEKINRLIKVIKEVAPSTPPPAQ